MPKDLAPSRVGLEIVCLLNPGVFNFKGKTWLLIRVAERPGQKAGVIFFPILKEHGIEIIEIEENHSDLCATDPRMINYQGADYLTLSHLRLMSDDSVHFYQPNDYPL